MHNFYSSTTKNLQNPLYCSNPDHENNKISFICLQEICQANSRLGCAHCFLEFHQNHINQKLKISVFQEKVSEKYNSLRKYCENIEDTAKDYQILEKITYDFDLLKGNFLKNIEIIQSNLIDFYKKKLQKTEVEKENIQVFIRNLEQISQKSLYIMNPEEIDLNVKLFADKTIEKKPKDFLKDFIESHQIIKESINSYLRDIRSDFEMFFKKLCENHGISRIQQKMRESSPKRDLPKTFSQKIKETGTFSKRIEENEENLRKTEPRRNWKNGWEREYLRKNAKNIFEITQNKCEHIRKPRVAMIFPCCKRAYLCINCHDSGSTHKWDRKKDIMLAYCLKCYTISKYKDEKCGNCLLSLKN